MMFEIPPYLTGESAKQARAFRERLRDSSQRVQEMIKANSGVPPKVDASEPPYIDPILQSLCNDTGSFGGE